jgi:hypothetical protein
MHMPAPNPSHNYVAASQPPSTGYQPQQQQHQMDTTGQTGPPGIKPKVTATLWEDEGSLCFQVEAKGVCVARREGTFHAIIDNMTYKSDSMRRQPFHQWHQIAECCRHDAGSTRWYLEEREGSSRCQDRSDASQGRLDPF